MRGLGLDDLIVEKHVGDRSFDAVAISSARGPVCRITCSEVPYFADRPTAAPCVAQSMKSTADMPDQGAAGRRLYLLDAMALAYRSHYVFINRPLLNSRGENTSATYGFVSALLKLIEDHGMEHIAVVFDVVGEGGTFRDEMYADYKANRDPPPGELLANLPLIKRVVRAMDIPVIEMPGVEADDVIGTLGGGPRRKVRGS